MLDLRGPDAVAGGGDDVVLAADIPEITVAILHAEIAGEQELPGIFLRGRVRIFPVLDHGAGIGLAHADDAALADRLFHAVLVDDADVEARRRTSHRSRPEGKKF